MSLLSQIGAALLVTALYAALFAAMELWRRRRPVAAEITRKGVHVGGGMIALALPALFDTHWPVLVLGSLLTAALLAARRRSLLPAVQMVERSTVGEILYPTAIYLAFLSSALTAAPHRYVMAILILALGDGAAGLVGERFGRHRYRVAGGAKSLEGSATFLAVVAAIVTTTLIISVDDAPLHALLVGLVVGLVAAGIEAISTHGLDNITVTLGSWGMLAVTERRGVDELLLDLVVAVVVTGVVILLSRGRQARWVTGIVGGALLLYGVWMLAAPTA